MTADDARRIVRDANAPGVRLQTTAEEETAILAMLHAWYAGIRKAAARGQTSVAETTLPPPRQLVSVKDRRAALDRLEAAGFRVNVVNLIATVSWSK